MNFIRSAITTFSMFSRIPMPKLEWKDENMRYLLASLPLVGAAIGGALWLWVWLCSILGFGQILFAAGLTLVPWAVSGGIHLDGFADTCDALGSNGPPEKKREILKDPRVGVFGSLGITVYLLAYFALCTEMTLSSGTVLFLGLAHIISRAVGAMESLTLPSNKSGGLSDTFRRAGGKFSVAVLALFFVLASAALSLLFSFAGATAVLASVLCFVYVAFISKKQFGGMSGDLAGYSIQLCELLMLAAYIVTLKAVAL